MNRIHDSSPWGEVQDRAIIAPGIVWVGTASHGGYLLDDAALASMPPALRNIVPWAGRDAYEEDCDWAIVVLAFPHLFKPDHVAAAVKSARLCTFWTHQAAVVAWLDSDEEGTHAVRERIAQMFTDYITEGA